MPFTNDKISVRQLQVLLMLDIFGTGVIVLPRRAVEYANQDGYLVIALATVIALLYAVFITSLGRLFPNDSFFTYTSKIVSRPIAVFLALGFVAKLIVNIALELRLFGEIIKQTLLVNTPFWLICVLMLFVAGYAASKGYETRARLGELFVFVVFLPIIVVFATAAFNTNISNVMPVLKTPPDMLLKGAFFSGGAAFTGLEICLLVYPFINKPRSVRKGVLVSVLIIGALMVFITYVTQATFGVADTKMKLWPVLEMMDVFKLTGAFMERQEALIMSFWIISVFFITNAGLFFSSLLLKDVVKIGTHSEFIVICGVVVFLLSLYPKNINEVYTYLDLMFSTVGIFYLVILPPLLFVIAKVRGLGLGVKKGGEQA